MGLSRSLAPDEVRSLSAPLNHKMADTEPTPQATEEVSQVTEATKDLEVEDTPAEVDTKAEEKAEGEAEAEAETAAESSESSEQSEDAKETSEAAEDAPESQEEKQEEEAAPQEES